VLTACDALGRDYFPVGNAIRSELLALLRDLPTLLSLTLMDDSPTANTETLVWLGDQHLLPEGTEAAAVPRSCGDAATFDVAQTACAGDSHTAMQKLLTADGQREPGRASPPGAGCQYHGGAGLNGGCPCWVLLTVDAHSSRNGRRALNADPPALLISKGAPRLREVDLTCLYPACLTRWPRSG
jgi:hypothetical protein